MRESSRSAIVDREECDRLRLLGWELDGTGYQPQSGSVALLSGIHIHEGFAHLLAPGGDPFSSARLDEAVTVMLDGYTHAFKEHGIRQAEGEYAETILKEQSFMLEVMLRGWVETRLALLLAEYEIMSVERAWSWPLAPTIPLPFRFDAILRRKADGILHVLDFKGASNDSADWQAQHEDSRQTILYLTALEEYTQEFVGGIIYEGIVRGRFARETTKKSPFYNQRIQQTPLVYGYRFLGEDGVNDWRHDGTPITGWVKTFAGEEFTPTEWVAFLKSRGALNKHFTAGVPVSPSPAFRQSQRRQIAHAELTFYAGLDEFNRLRAIHEDDTHPEIQDHLERWAPQKTGRCNKYGEDYRCVFRKDGLCFMPNATEVLKDEPGFAPRIPHHAPTRTEPNE